MKTLVIDAIVGVGFPSVVLAGECERVGLAKFNGDQWNPGWVWLRDRLEAVELESLQELYQGMREAREENVITTPEEPESLIILQ